ncbi:MAG TPA: SRPBCC family protein [Thermomicrobiales bacterium]|nr:SRPBCC family protein [Thermomicrobiales bacterium]
MQQRAHDVEIEVERWITAPADLIYPLIADYRTHHPAILPPAFSNFTVEQGGVGDGTVIGFDLALGGRTRRMRALISEPRPGLLQETDPEFGAVTTFEVTQQLNASRVVIQTGFPSAPGIQGWFERRFAPRMLRRLYQQELDNLAAYVSRQPVEPTSRSESASIAS